MTDSDGKLKKDIDNEDTDLDKTKFFYKTPEESKYEKVFLFECVVACLFNHTAA